MISLGIESVLISSVSDGDWDAFGRDVRVGSLDDLDTLLWIRLLWVLDVTVLLSYGAIRVLVGPTEGAILAVVVAGPNINNVGIWVWLELLWASGSNGHQG